MGELTTEQRAIRALVSMVFQDIPGCADMDPDDYGIAKPHREFISYHLSAHAEALRVLGSVGAMDIEDRGGRCVLGNFKPDWLIDNGFVAYAWQCRCDIQDREDVEIIRMVEIDRDGNPIGGELPEKGETS